MLKRNRECRLQKNLNFVRTVLWVGVIFILVGCASSNDPALQSVVNVPTPAFGSSPTPESAGVAQPVIVVSNNGDQGGEVRPTWTPLPTQTSAACQLPIGWITYRVEAGNSLSFIAKWSGSTVEELARVNCIADPTRIEVGQLLYVPREISPTQTPETTETPIPTPTLTPAPTSSMSIDFFFIEPTMPKSNSEITIRWQVSGDGEFLLSWTQSGVQEILQQGEQGEYTLTHQLPDIPHTTPFVLSVIDLNGNTAEQLIELDIACPYEYFVEDLAELENSCPWGDPTIEEGSWQKFENGFMVMHETRNGNSVIAVFGEDGELLDLTGDLWNGEEVVWLVEPPAGLIQPTESFGAIWINDDAIRTKLGWATDAAVEYEATSQQVDVRGWKDIVIGDTYLMLPDGRIVRYTARFSEQPNRWFWVK